MNNQAVFGTTNFLVPAAGQTHCVTVNGTPFTNQPYPVDWRNFKVDNFPFQPQGVIIDNSLATSPVTVTILPIGFPVTCPAGGVLQTPFPAPNGQTAQIIGGGNDDITNVYFVDYPVLPFYFNAAGGGIETVSVLGGSLDPLSGNNTPYAVQQTPGPNHYFHTSIAAGATTSTITCYLRATLMHLIISISGDATLAAAGTVDLSVTCAGTTILTKTLAIGTAGGVLGGYDLDLDFSQLGIFTTPTDGDITVTLSSALATGTVDMSIYQMNQYNVPY